MFRQCPFERRFRYVVPAGDFFAVLGDVNRASNFVDTASNRGQAMAIKSHTFMTSEERLRRKIRRRKRAELSKITEEEALTFLKLMSLAG